MEKITIRRRIQEIKFGKTKDNITYFIFQVQHEGKPLRLTIGPRLMRELVERRKYLNGFGEFNLDILIGKILTFDLEWRTSQFYPPHWSVLKVR